MHEIYKGNLWGDPWTYVEFHEIYKGIHQIYMGIHEIYKRIHEIYNVNLQGDPWDL